MSEKERAAVTDIFNRPLRDLRVSVTDRCNLRCRFCMPPDQSYTFLPRSEILSFEEIARIVRLFAECGVRKVRLTGGEPLIRRNIESLISMISSIEGIEDIAMTTNGLLLPEKAQSLKEAGLRRVTISLHSLDDRLFGYLNGRNEGTTRVLEAIDAALAVGLTPVKVNCVVIRGINDDHILDLIEFARHKGVILRFIEYMDVGTVNEWRPDMVVTAREIVDRIHRVWPVEPLPPRNPHEVATRYRFYDMDLEFGVIASVSQPFCQTCSRARLSADGKIYTCLFAGFGHDLKTLLRSGASDDRIREKIRNIWRRRLDRYSEERSVMMRHHGLKRPERRVEMFHIGG